MRALSLDQLQARLDAAVQAGDLAAGYAFAERFDLLAGSRPGPALLPSALWYASQEVPVFPLRERDKRPRPGFRWREEASTDPEKIRAWWAEWPAANLGLATGFGLDVIDVDGPAGVASWLKLRDLPPVLGVVSTPRPGGAHLYVSSDGTGNQAHLMPSVDYRGLGGYVVAPPSIHPNGGTYRWRRPLQLEAPTTLLLAA